MRPVSISQTGVGTSVVVPPDYNAGYFNVQIQAKVTGTATFTIQATLDDVFSPNFNPSTATWFPVTGFNGLSANAHGNTLNPVRGFRLNVTSGTGTVDVIFVQGSAPGL